MRKTLILVLLTLAIALPAAPTAKADPLLCVNDLCLDVGCGAGFDCAGGVCPSIHIAGAGVWYYDLASLGLRDPPLPGTYYAAGWSASTYYEDTGSGCAEVAYSCRVQVSDGSHFQYLRVGTLSSASGSYKGIATAGGSLSCSQDYATLHTSAAALLRLDGYGFPVPIVQE